MIGELKRNKLFDDYCWMGAQSMPDFDVSVLSDDTCYIPEPVDYELCMSDWWPWFTADSDI